MYKIDYQIFNIIIEINMEIKLKLILSMCGGFTMIY